MNEHLSNSAQQHLAGLRRALESRLAALEAVLADPSRGESLAGLILDLSRIATEEAQAAASEACIATKAEADKEIATFRTSAKAALDAAQSSLKATQVSLDEERAIGTELRRAVDQAQLESRKQAGLLAAREQLEVSLRSDRERLEGEVVRHQSTVADLQRAAGDLQRAAADAKQQLETERRSSADWQSQLEAERASGIELRRLADSAAERLPTLERELVDKRAAHEAAVADLSDERAAHEAAVADLSDERAAHEAAVADLGDERAARNAVVADLAAARAAHQAAVAELADEQAAHEAAVADLGDARTAHQAVVADLARERNAGPDRDHAYTQLQSQLEAERATVAGLRQAVVRAEELNATISRETSSGEEAQEEAALLRTSLAEARKALAAAQTELESERASTAEVRQISENTDQQLASARSMEAQAVADHQKLAAQLVAMITERDAVADELAAARQVINQPRAAEPGFALPPAPAAVEQPPAKVKARAKTHAHASKPEPVEPEGGWQSIRLANRYVFSEELSVQVNGNPARLSDLSASGCQLLSPTALKPNQMVKIVLPDTTPVACAGKVVWTRLEPMAAGQPLGYRAGVHFTKSDGAAIEAFAVRHGTPA